MNLKKDEELRVRRSGTVSKLYYWPGPNHTHSAVSFPPLFCSRTLQYRIPAAVQLYSNYSNSIPPWAKTITCLRNNISSNPYLPAPSVFLSCCHHVRSHKPKLLRESKSTSYQIITFPLQCNSDPFEPFMSTTIITPLISSTDTVLP